MRPFYLLASDLNGTLVHADTQLDMIEMGFPREPGRLEAARRAFALQADGKLSLEETLRTAGEQTRGLPLQSAIISLGRMRFVDGFAEFVAYLQDRRLATAIVTTAYSVTLYAMRYRHPENRFFTASNQLVFASEEGGEIPEEDLERAVRLYFENPAMQNDRFFRTSTATGEVRVHIREEGDKARIAMAMGETLGIPPSRTIVMGDTMGDSLGILALAKAGGLGIAFNYNRSLETFLRSEAEREIEEGRIVLIDPKGPRSDLRHVIPFLERFRRS